MIDNLRRVLIVEDDKETAELFSEMLTVGGYHVQVCFDGKQALQALKFALPDVIVLDMVLPDCSGMDVLQHLQEKRQRSPDAGNAPIPVVVVSSRGLPADIIKAKKAGASEYLTKPVSYLDLNQAVGKVLELSI